MPHTTEIIEIVNLSDGQKAIRVRCCADDSTISALTVDSVLIQQPQVLSELIAQHRQAIAQRHEAHLRAGEHLAGLVGQKVEHLREQC
jgi:hypothetical protein